MRSLKPVGGLLILAAMSGVVSRTYALPPGDPGVARTLYSVANRFGAGDKVKLALFEAAVVESKMQNLSWGDRDSRGVLQIRTSLWGWATATNPALSAEWFLRRAIPRQNWFSSAGALAQSVQGSALPWRYDQEYWNAMAWLNYARAAAIPPADYVMYRLRLNIGQNVHNGPSWGTHIAGVLKAGTIVDVYGFANGWLKIWYSASWQYLAPGFSTKIGLSVQCTRDVRVETGSGLAGWLPQNAIIHCWAWSNGWYRVWWNGAWRWIYSLYTRQA